MKNLTIEDINYRLGIGSTLKAGNGVIVDTGTTHYMDPNYGSFMS